MDIVLWITEVIQSFLYRSLSSFTELGLHWSGSFTTQATTQCINPKLLLFQNSIWVFYLEGLIHGGA